MNLFAMAVMLMLFSQLTFAQGSELYGSGMKFKFNEDGSKYLRVISWAQVWTRYNVNNGGTTRQGAPESGTFDVGLRRARMLFMSQLDSRFLIVMHFGINNENALANANGTYGAGAFKPGIFFHDAYVDYKVANKGQLNIGAGLHYWNGISRMTNTSTLNFMTLDAPICNWPTIDKLDQFGRQFGIFAKGKLEKLDYRVALNVPFAAQAAIGVPVNATKTANFNPKNNSVVLQGYFNYQFWDQESNLLPYMVGTYLGTKKVFNIGAGFQNSFDAMRQLNGPGDTQTRSLTIFSADAFLDMPLSSKKDAITAYAAYYNYNFGRDYVRYIGIMNPADAATSTGASNGGNATPTVGTGQSIYANCGYLLPKGSGSLRIQPYVNGTLSQFYGLKKADGSSRGWFLQGDVGCNWMLEGHHAKITTDIGMRPDFNDVNNTKIRPCFTVQTVIYL